DAGGIVSYFALMKFSRDDEREADFLGVYNLYELGYDPSGMVTLFEKFKKLQGSEPSKFERWFLSHPSPSERVENTDGEIKKLTIEYLKKDDPQFQIIKQHLQGLPQPIIKQLLVNDTLLVQANSLSWYEVKIDTSIMKNYELKGVFVASGGSGNDIQVFLFDQVNFLNWKNGHEASSIYSSGQVTAGKINLPFKQSGTYYLVFDNRFSSLTSKSVVVSAWAEFTLK
ncbi:MAG: M48 family metalloprotease, partial [candidate division Zixibacteria bacterium]|nr:M48 family metalloprotease [candidate division Zixibacteria bacterium]